MLFTLLCTDSSAPLRRTRTRFTGLSALHLFAHLVHHFTSHTFHCRAPVCEGNALNLKKRFAICAIGEDWLKGRTGQRHWTDLFSVVHKRSTGYFQKDKSEYFAELKYYFEDVCSTNSLSKSPPLPPGNHGGKRRLSLASISREATRGGGQPEVGHIGGEEKPHRTTSETLGNQAT